MTIVIDEQLIYNFLINIGMITAAVFLWIYIGEFINYLMNKLDKNKGFDLEEFIRKTDEENRFKKK